VPLPRPLFTCAALGGLALLASTAVACSGAEDGSTGAPNATTEPAPATTSPFEIFVTEDRVRVGLQGIFDDTAVQLVTFTAEEQACIDQAGAAAPGLAGLAIAPPGTVDDPDTEQVIAEIVVGCLPIDRLADVVVDQLSAQPALAGVERSCIQREVRTLATQPDVLAAVLRGDENGLPAVAGSIEDNCRT
jgi:hypothetical protein